MPLWIAFMAGCYFGLLIGFLIGDNKTLGRLLAKRKANHNKGLVYPDYNGRDGNNYQPKDK